MPIQISWLLQKPTDLDLRCLQRQGISGFSRTRVKVNTTVPVSFQPFCMMHAYCYKGDQMKKTGKDSLCIQIRGVASNYQINSFLISPWKHMLCYLLEPPQWGGSNEYPQHMFSWRHKKIVGLIGWKKYLIWSYKTYWENITYHLNI